MLLGESEIFTSHKNVEGSECQSHRIRGLVVRYSQ